MLLLLLVAMGLGTVTAPVSAQSGGVTRFASAPPSQPGHFEGIAVGPSDKVYAGSFELTEVGFPPFLIENVFPARRKGPGGDPQTFAYNYIYEFDANGRLEVSVPLPSLTVPLGMVADGDVLYFVNVLQGTVVAYQLPLNATSTPKAVYPVCGGYLAAFGPNPETFCALNDITKGPDGAFYLSDNGDALIGQTTGQIFRLDLQTGSSLFFQDAVLNPSGTPGTAYGTERFGVNGLAFAPAGFTPGGTQKLIMANMSTDTLWQVTVRQSGATLSVVGAPTVFAQGGPIDGPDDSKFDDKGRLWVTSGQKHQVVALNGQGQVVETRGSFDGFLPDGAPKSLCQPSSLDFSKRLGMLVANECNNTLLPPDFDLSKLATFTISRFNP